MREEKKKEIQREKEKKSIYCQKAIPGINEKNREKGIQRFIKRKRERIISRIGLVWFYGILTLVAHLTPNPFLCK